MHSLGAETKSKQAGSASSLSKVENVLQERISKIDLKLLQDNIMDARSAKSYLIFIIFDKIESKKLFKATDGTLGQSHKTFYGYD